MEQAETRTRFFKEEVAAVEEIAKLDEVVVLVTAYYPESISLTPSINPSGEAMEIDLKKYLELKGQEKTLEELFEKQGDKYAGVKEGWEQRLADILGKTTKTYTIDRVGSEIYLDSEVVSVPQSKS